MSTRTTIFANPGAKQEEIAEGMYGVPLLWIPMMSSMELATQLADGCICVERKAAMQRLADAIPFLADQFSDIDEIAEQGEALIKHLKKFKVPTIGIDIGEPIAMNPKGFSNALTASVKAIEDRDATAKLKVGRHTHSLRDVLCIVSTLDPESGLAETEQMIGVLW